MKVFLFNCDLNFLAKSWYSFRYVNVMMMFYMCKFDKMEPHPLIFSTYNPLKKIVVNHS